MDETFPFLNFNTAAFIYMGINSQQITLTHIPRQKLQWMSNQDDDPNEQRIYWRDMKSNIFHLSLLTNLGEKLGELKRREQENKDPSIGFIFVKC